MFCLWASGSEGSVFLASAFCSAVSREDAGTKVSGSFAWIGGTTFSSVPPESTDFVSSVVGNGSFSATVVFAPRCAFFFLRFLEALDGLLASCAFSLVGESNSPIDSSSSACVSSACHSLQRPINHWNSKDAKTLAKRRFPPPP